MKSTSNLRDHSPIQPFNPQARADVRQAPANDQAGPRRVQSSLLTSIPTSSPSEATSADFSAIPIATSEVTQAKPEQRDSIKAAIRATPEQKTTERFFKSILAGTLEKSTVELKKPLPPERANDVSIEKYVKTYRVAAAIAFQERVDLLQEFAGNNEKNGVAKKVTSDLKHRSENSHFMIANSVDINYSLMSFTLPQLHQLVNVVHDDKLPLQSRIAAMNEMNDGLDKCPGGVSNAIDRAAKKASMLCKELPGVIAQFKQDAADSVALDTDSGESETHYRQSLVRAIAEPLGIPRPVEDPLIRYAITENIIKSAVEEVRDACKPALVIDNFSSRISDHVRSAAAMKLRELRELRESESAATSTNHDMNIDEVFTFANRMAQEISDTYHIPFTGLDVIDTMFTRKENSDGEDRYTFLSDPTLVQVKVRDALGQAGYIEFKPTTIASTPEGNKIQFDGDRFYMETSDGKPKRLTMKDLEHLDPAEFGEKRKDLTLHMIRFAQGDELDLLQKRNWLNSKEAKDSEELKDAWIKKASSKEQAAVSSIEQKAERISALLRVPPGMSFTNLVDNGWIDPKTDQSELFASLIKQKHVNSARVLLDTGKFEGGAFKTTINNWERNPASLAIYGGHHDLYKQLEKAGWKPSTSDGSKNAQALTAAIIRENNLNGLQIVLDANLLEKSLRNGEALQLAADSNNLEAMKRLRNHEVRRNREPVLKIKSNDITPLSRFIEHGNNEAVSMLLPYIKRDKFEKQFNTQRRFGGDMLFPLEYAIKANKLDIAKSLIKHGASTKLGDFNALALARSVSSEMEQAVQEAQKVFA